MRSRCSQPWDEGCNTESAKYLSSQSWSLVPDRRSTVPPNSAAARVAHPDHFGDFQIGRANKGRGTEHAPEISNILVVEEWATHGIVSKVRRQALKIETHAKDRADRGPQRLGFVAGVDTVRHPPLDHASRESPETRRMIAQGEA
jgi:hypothetical protein